MIGNISRAFAFQNCRQKAKYVHIDGLRPVHDEAIPLMVGEAYHKGCATLTATKDRKKALESCESAFRERLATLKLLPEELVLYEQEIALSMRMIESQAEQYEKDDWTVLMNEVEFLVPFPNSTHHCAVAHMLLYPNGTAAFDVCSDERCRIPHYLKGKTDAVLSWNKLIFLLERKTSSDPREQFWQQWTLDIQPLGYIYGIWKATGVRPNGFVIERMLKPRKNARDPFHIPPPEREPYIKTDADLANFEREFPLILSDWEDALINDKWYRNTKSCFSYNRACYFLDVCKNNGIIPAGAFTQKDPDYVDKAMYTLLGLEVPIAKV